MSVLAKATDILEVLASSATPVRLGDLATQLDMPKSSLHRLVQEMTGLGIVRNVGDGRYQLGARLIRWGNQSEESFDLRSLCLPHMQQLRDQVGETVNLYVPVEAGRVCLASVPGRRLLGYRAEVGVPRPAGLGAAGKLIMAYAGHARRERIRRANSLPLPSDDELDRLCRQGWAISWGEVEPGLVVVGAALSAEPESLLGVLAIAGSAGIMTPEHVREILPSLQQTAALVSQELAVGV